MYSIYLKGSGGKGVATGAAVVLALVPQAFVICFSVWIVLLVTTRYVSVGSLAASFLVPVLVIAFQRPAAVPDRGGAGGHHRVVGAPRQHPAPRQGHGEQRVTLPWTRSRPQRPRTGGLTCA